MSFTNVVIACQFLTFVVLGVTFMYHHNGRLGVVELMYGAATLLIFWQ